MDTLIMRAEETEEKKYVRKSVSIVIVTWNCKKYMDECLQSLRAYSNDPRMEVLVVDNASSDGTPELVRDCYPEVTLVQTNRNLGFAKGNNVGIRMCSGKYIFLINPDVKIQDGCIERMIAYMDENPKIGLLGPRMLGGDGKPYRSYMSEPTLWRMFCRALALDSLFPKSKLFGGYLMPYFDGNRTAEVDVLNGWFWMTRMEAVNHVGMLDESLFMYGDDLDWCKRFRQAGWKIVFFPEVASIHYGGGSSSNAPVRFSVEMQRANFQYWQKNFGLVSQKMFLAIVAFHQSIRFLGNALLFAVARSKRPQAAGKIKKSLACLRWAVGFGYERGVKA